MIRMDKIYHETASALHSEHPLAREKLAKKRRNFCILYMIHHEFTTRVETQQTRDQEQETKGKETEN